MNPTARNLLAQATDHFARARALQPASDRYARGLGKALLWQGDAQAALTHLSFGVGLGTAPSALLTRALAHYACGDMKEAIAWSTASLEESPLCTRAYALRAEARRILHDETGSLADLHESLRCSEDGDGLRLWVCARLADAAFKRAGPEKVELLGHVRDQLVEGMLPGFQAGQRYLLGCVFLALGEPRRATIHFGRASAFAEDDLLLRHGVAELLLGHDEVAQAYLDAVASGEAACAGEARRVLRLQAQGRSLQALPGDLVPPPLLQSFPLALESILPACVSPRPHFVPERSGDAGPVSLEASSERARRPSPAATEELALIEAPSNILSPREATWERKKAQELVQAAEERLAEEREDLAAATFCRAFDVLDRPELDGSDVDALRLNIVRQLATMAGQPGVIPSLVARGGKCMKALTRDEPDLAVRVVEWSLGSESAPAVYETLVDALVNRLPLRRASAAHAHRILAKGLEVRLGTMLPDGHDVRRLLLRLHVGRPELPYPRLYLARLFSMEERYEEAAEILNGLVGDLALRTRVLNLRGRCAELLGRCDQAEAFFEESLKRRPDQADVHFRLGRLTFLRVLDETGQPSPFEETQRSRSLSDAKSGSLRASERPLEGEA